jgi:two-component system chemotaxis sensor kinase CheA
MTMAPSTLHIFVGEAHDILDALVKGLLALDHGAPSAPAISELFRAAHTLKGAARVVKQPAIAEMAHVMEDVLAAHRDAGTALAPQEIDELLRLLDALEEQLGALRAAAPPEPGVVAAPPEPAGRVRVDAAGLDELAAELIGLEAALAGLRDDEAALDRARRRAGAEALAEELERLHRRARARADAMERSVRQARALCDELRLAPAAEVFPQLERAARDAARETGRRVEIEAEGGAVRLDRTVLLAARDALLHVVRNAVMHGIEPAAERAGAGKPEAGRIRVRAERRGDRIAFTCGDDGRGADLAAVRRAAIERGIVDARAAEALDDRAALDLVFAPGLTTAATVTELSGRGVGLDAVRAAAGRLRGRVSAESRPGQGLTLTLDLPVSLALYSALAVEAAGRRALIPTDAVEATRVVSDDELVTTADGPAVRHDGVLLPVVPLSLLLGAPPAPRTRPRLTVAVVRAGGRAVALAVDALGAVREVAVRPLPKAAGRSPILAGAAVDEGGAPTPVLDPEGLVSAARAGAAAHVAPPEAPPKRDPVLVIDDSITTRILEQSMLEAAGWEVELAASAEEGLALAAARAHALFIVDIEMPGMNGLDLVATFRADAALRDTPIILLTSLSSADDRERGERAGADAYLVKGELEQGAFLRNVEELTR